jgi:hypothetical protein
MATTTVTVPIPIVQTSGGFFKIVMACCLLSSLIWFIREFYMTMMTQSQTAPTPLPSECIKTGLSSSTKDGSDCCTMSMDFNNVCQPKPGQPSSSLGAPMS